MASEKKPPPEKTAEEKKPPPEKTAEEKKKEAKEIVGCVEYANEYGAEYLVPEPKAEPERRCENEDCRAVLPPGWSAVYCSNSCAASDA